MRRQLIDDSRAGASGDLQQSGTEGHQAIRIVRYSSKQNHAQTRTVPKSNRRYDDSDHGHNAHTEASNVHSSSSSRTRLPTVAGKLDDDNGAHSEMMNKNSQANQGVTKTRSVPRPSLGQSNIGGTLLRDAEYTTTKNGDKRPLRKNMDRMAGFDGGPFTVPARSARRRVQRETGAVPVPVPGKGTRPSPVQSTSTAAIEIGKNNANGQGPQSSSFANIERPILYWAEQSKKKREKRRVAPPENTVIFDVDALDAERLKRAAMLKKITFSKKKVKEEEREEEDVLRVGMGDADVDGKERREESGGGGESREATVNGREMLERPQREHSPWTWDGPGNIPGLSAPARSARIHRPYDLPQAAGIVNVETKAVPIPLPSLFPEPPDSVSDISDEDLYSPKEGAQVQVKEEQRDVFFDSDIFPDLQTPATIDLEQNATAQVDNSATYTLDTECTIHPKNKRKQHNLSHVKNAPSPKKVKTDVCASNVGEGQSGEVVHVQDEAGGEIVPSASVPACKKKGKQLKKRKEKKKRGKHEVETPVVTLGGEVSLTGGEDEMEICAVETKQGEIPTGDALSLAAVSTGGPLDSQIGIGETTGIKESECTGENAESAEQDEAGVEIPVSPTGPLPASASVHDATAVEPSAPDIVIKKSSRKGKKKGRATENGAGSRKKRKGRGQTTETGEQTQNHDANLEGDKEVSHPNETPRKKRKKNDQAIEGVDCQGGVGPAGDGEEPTEGGERDPVGDEHIPQREETPRQMNDQTTEGGERTEEGLARDEYIPQQEETLNDQTAAGGDRTEGGPAGNEHIPQQEETPRRMNDQTTEGGEGTDVGPAGNEHIPQQEEAPTKMKDQTTVGRDDEHTPQQEAPMKMNDQMTVGTEGDLAEDEHIPQQDEPPRKMNDQTTVGGERAEGGDEHMPQQEETPIKMNDRATVGGEGAEGGPAGDEHTTQQEMLIKMNDQATGGGQNIQGSSAGSTAADDIARPDETPTKKKGKATDQSATEGAPEAEKKVVKKGRPPKEKMNDDTNGETSLMKMTEENGAVKEVKAKTRGRKKRATMGESMTDGMVRKKKRIQLTLEEGGAGNRQSGKTGKSTVKWMLVCKNRTATGRKASRQSKGKEKAQSTATALGADMDEHEFKEETEGNVKKRKTLRPSIWASSKTELLLVLPELSGSKCFNGVTEGSSNFPMVMLDESTAGSIGVDVRWFDGEESEGSGETPSVRLTLARDFVCPVPERASTGGMLMDSVSSSDVGPSSSVMTQPNVPSSSVPGASSALNPYGNGWGPLPVILPYDDNDRMDLEYIDEDAPQGGAVPTLSVPPVKMSPVFPTPIVPYAPPIAQDPMAHISHNVQGFFQAPALPTYHPAIQFGPYNPITLSTPSMVFPSLQFQHLLPFQHDQFHFPQSYTTAPVPIPIPSKVPLYDDKPPPPTPSEPNPELDTIIPPNPPPEIEILTSSWKLSLPLILISSHETFKRHFWGPLTPPPHPNGPGDSPEQAEKVGLAAEHAYVFLGFFSVVKMGERRVALSDDERVNLTPGKVAGRVEWTFDVEWVPGYHGSKGGSEELNRPWWAPDFVFGRPVGRERGSKKGFTWLEKHAQARLNLLPMQLVDGQEAGSSDEAMPKGWLCKACGKLNQKVMMRHRWCGSRMCRDNPLSRGYAVDLSSARDANQTALALPINTCNRRTVDASVADWDDGMRTLKYRPMSIPDRLGNAGGRSGILQHVFTCNLVDLQTEATALFESIQSEVCLMKSTGDSGPFFKSHVSNSYANTRDKYAFSSLSWSEAPQAVREAQDLMTFMGKKYGEEETLDIDKLTIVGWVSSGTRKTPTILAAREHAIAMLCLGNDVVLTIVPKWEASAPVPASFQVQQLSNLSYPSYVSPFAPDAEMVNPVALPPSIPVLPHVATFTSPNIRSTLARTPRPIKPPSADQVQLVDVATTPATKNHVRQVDAISENPSSGVVPISRNSRSKPASKVKPKPKQASESMSVTLVHGDMLLFSGCDFEYSIKRMGTSILVIGSKEDSTASI